MNLFIAGKEKYKH